MNNFLTSILGNPLLDTDGYKVSHYLCDPPGTTHKFNYFESRGGRFNPTIFFGLQYILKAYFSEPITLNQVYEANDFYKEFSPHVPFNLEGWETIAMNLGGRLPLRIQAVREGAGIDQKNILLSCVNTVPGFQWLPGWFETSLMRLWEGTTVCSNSFEAKKALYRYYEKSADSMDSLNYALVDFGSRGVTGREQSIIAGMANIVHFETSDNVSAVVAGNKLYNHPMCAVTVGATEHSVMTVWGRERERESIVNAIKVLGKPGGFVSIVLDSYDYFNALKTIICSDEVKDLLNEIGCTLVVRPDSGEPMQMVLESLRILESFYGVTVNKKGYKVINGVRVLQGDGIDVNSMQDISAAVLAEGFSIECVVFGMGSGLLQKNMDRDTNMFAIKCSAAYINGQWVDVYKDPITSPNKQSKRGLLDLIPSDEYEGKWNRYKTVKVDTLESNPDSQLITYFCDGLILVDDTYDNIRARAKKVLEREVGL